jgi:excisionase family DNA binding protein
MTSLLSRPDLIISDAVSRMAGTSALALKQGRNLGDGNVGIPMASAGGETTLLVPEAIAELMAEILANVAEGRPVTLVPENAELTIPEAADLLNVSRPYVAGLLDRAELPYRGQGAHRRVVYRDLAAYKERSDAASREAIRELAELSQEMEPG